MVAEIDSVPKKRRERSPAYPAIDLETAIQRLAIVYERESRQPVPISVLMEHWNFTPKSSYGLQTVAALLKYALMADEGSGLDRSVKITDLGLSILIPENESEKQAAIREAALYPAIISDVWTYYKGQLPSDGTIKVYLIRQKGFNPRSVDEVIGIIRRTIDFSKLSYGNQTEDEYTSSRIVQDPENMWNSAQLTFAEEKVDIASQERTSPPQEARSGYSSEEPQVRTILLPLLEGKWASLQAPFPIGEDDWQQMQSVLSAMKPGLTLPSPQEPTGNNVGTTEELETPEQ